MSGEALSILGLIMNSEHPELTQDNLNDPMGDSLCDQRVFRNFVKLRSLHNCPAFMIAKTEQAVQTQVHTLYNVREKCRLSAFRTVQQTEVMKQFKLSVSAIHEELKVLSFVPGNKWAEQMETERMNLLRSTSLDSEIASNMGNDNHILPTLLNLLRRLDPALGQKYDDSSSQQKSNKDDMQGKEQLKTVMRMAKMAINITMMIWIRI